MPLIISPTDAALSIGAKCGGSAPAADDAALLAILKRMTTRVEGAMNVYSLTRKFHMDRFVIRRSASTTGDDEIQLRLTNGYIVPDTVTITDPDGLPYDDTDYPVDIDHKLGIVTLNMWSKGVWFIQYEAGLEVDETTDAFQSVPPWMEDLAITYLVKWYRTTYLTPRLGGKEAVSGLRVLNEMLDKELIARLYNQYYRPRLDVVWGDRRAGD